MKPSDALTLAQTWLANSVPTVQIDGPTPLPALASAIPIAQAMEAVVEAATLLFESAKQEANEKGLGGYHAARLTDMQNALHILESLQQGENQ